MKHIIWSIGHPLKLNNIVYSDNCFLFDSLGNRFIDLESGVWCTSVGHNNKRINNVIVSQINRITHSGYCYCNPQIEETAKKILEITGINDGMCEFLSVAVSQKKAEKLRSSGFKYSQSHQNDPLGAIVASEVISIIDNDGLLEKCCQYGDYIKEKILEMKSETSLLKDIRGRGLMIAIELKKNAQAVFEELLKQGFIVAFAHPAIENRLSYSAITPSYTFTFSA